jgi:hypothetical protein
MFISEAVDLIKTMLVRQPSKRASLIDVKNHPWFQSLCNEKAYNLPNTNGTEINRAAIHFILDSGILHTLDKHHLQDFGDTPLEDISDAQVESLLIRRLTDKNPFSYYHPLVSLYLLIRDRGKRKGSLLPEFKITSPSTIEPNHSTIQSPVRSNQPQRVLKMQSLPTVQEAPPTTLLKRFSRDSTNSPPKPSKHRKGKSISRISFFSSLSKTSREPCANESTQKRKNSLPNDSLDAPNGENKTEFSNDIAPPDTWNVNGTQEKSVTGRFKRALSISIGVTMRTKSSNSSPVKETHSSDSPPRMPFVKGLFSTKTTSFKAPQFIRDELIHQLNGRKIAWKPSPDNSWTLFCTFNQENRVSEQVEHSPRASVVSELPRSDSKFSHQSGNEDSGVDSPGQTSESDIFEAAQELFDSSAEDVVNKPKEILNPNLTQTTIQFEISIVKISLFVTSMHAVRFHKLQGSPWIFKTVAQDILRSLSL